MEKLKDKIKKDKKYFIEAARRLEAAGEMDDHWYAFGKFTYAQELLDFLNEATVNEADKLFCPNCKTDASNLEQKGTHVYCNECEYEWNWG